MAATLAHPTRLKQPIWKKLSRALLDESGHAEGRQPRGGHKAVTQGKESKVHKPVLLPQTEVKVLTLPVLVVVLLQLLH